MLNTEETYIQKCKDIGVRVVNFEDLGSGAKIADVVINDFYAKQNNLPNHQWGSEFYLLRDEFLLALPAPFNKEVREIVVLFGGTDPSNLTKRLMVMAAEIITKYTVHFTFVLGIGYRHVESIKDSASKFQNIDVVKDVKNMTEIMGKADLAISSLGRTMYELTTMTVPTILLAQNDRELVHEFGQFQNGFIKLGLGTEVDSETIKKTIVWLMESPQIRYQIKQQMAKNNFKNGFKAVKKHILGEE